MITGFNTDIEYKGITYHVQTEDKGLNTPFILSLIYDGGTILASKRSPYEDLVQDFDEKILAERLQKQHKLICAAIRAGRLEDLKKMSRREVSKHKQQSDKSAEHINSKPGINGGETLKTNLSEPSEKETRPENNLSNASPATGGQAKNLASELSAANSSAPNNSPNNSLSENLFPPASNDNKLFLHDLRFDSEFRYSIDLTQDDLIIDEVNSEEEFVFPSEGVEIITEKISKAIEEIPPEKSAEDLLDTDDKQPGQTAEPISDDKIRLDILGEKQYEGGKSEDIKILVSRGEYAIPYAHVVIKVLGTNFRPVIFHTKTDRNGLASVQINIPDFSRGRAALLIKATSENEETEIRKIISPV